MARADEIAMLIPLYRQFIARQRQIEQRQADKLRQKQRRRETPAQSAVVAADTDAGTDVPDAAEPGATAEEVAIAVDPED